MLRNELHKIIRAHTVAISDGFGKAEADKLSPEAALVWWKRWAYSLGWLSGSFLEDLASRSLSGALAFLF